MSHTDTTRLMAKTLGQLIEASKDPAMASMSMEDLTALLERLSTPPAPPPEADGQRPQRWQDRLIEQRIAPGSFVLDLGCGTGELIARLMQHRNVRGQGVELDAEAVFQCAARGVPVFQSDLDEGLKGFADQSFDYVVLEETLQTLRRPVDVLEEMLRVGRHGIVSFPNFAYWRVRLNLALGGRMPETENLPYRWYDTPNIHLFTLQDFLDWAGKNGVRIVEGHVLAEGVVRPLKEDDNLHAEEVLVVVERATA